jgi:RNA polymerase primary sigma factor
MSKKNRLAGLTAEQQKRLKERFGVGVQADKALEDVVKRFDLTRQRIRKIEAKVRKKSGTSGDQKDSK